MDFCWNREVLPDSYRNLEFNPVLRGIRSVSPGTNPTRLCVIASSTHSFFWNTNRTTTWNTHTLGVLDSRDVFLPQDVDILQSPILTDSGKQAIRATGHQPGVLCRSVNILPPLRVPRPASRKKQSKQVRRSPVGRKSVGNSPQR